jgi:pimeloyl-ACP methyl ester carboxylesterase
VLLSAISHHRPASERPLGWKILHSTVMSSDLSGWLLTGLVRVVARTTVWGTEGRRRAEVRRRLVATLVPSSLRRLGHANDSAQFGLLPDQVPMGITCPTLIIHGTADGPVPFRHASRAAAAIPNAELVAVPGVGHDAFSPSETLGSKVAEFLEKSMAAAR